MNMQAEASTESLPWYRYPLVWFVIAVPLSAVLFGVVMIVSANYAPDDLVVDNYYKEGMGINRRIREDQLAAEIGAAVSLQALTPEGIVLRVEGGSEQLELYAYHVTDRSMDIRVPLVQAGEVYTGRSPALSVALQSPGIWYIEVRDEARGWRVRERVNSPVESLEITAHE